MENNKKHPIIANGQSYIEPLKKKYNGHQPTLPHEYEEAKARLCSDINNIQAAIRNSDEIFLNEKIVCIRLEPKYEAKSYRPSSLVAESGMKFIGGRKYTLNFKDNSKAKLYFVRTDDTELSNLKGKLENGEKDNQKNWKEQICRIHSIDLLRPEEKKLGFPDS